MYEKLYKYYKQMFTKHYIIFALFGITYKLDSIQYKNTHKYK